jgi:hypothetical protein
LAFFLDTIYIQDNPEQFRAYSLSQSMGMLIGLSKINNGQQDKNHGLYQRDEPRTMIGRGAK